jgi:hypothetical protein
MWHSVTHQTVSEVPNEHSTYFFKCQAIQEELTLCSSETYDTTQPKILCHITEDLKPHLGSAYRMWWDMIHLPHFFSPSNRCSRNVDVGLVVSDVGLVVSDATDLSVVARNHKEHRSQMSPKSSCSNFPHFKYCIPNIIVNFPQMCVYLLSEIWGKNMYLHAYFCSLYFLQCSFFTYSYAYQFWKILVIFLQ